MATYYIDPTWGGTKSGTFANPYSTYTSVTAPAPGDFILQKAGTTFSGHTTPPSTKSGTSGSPITYGVYDATTGAQIATTVGAATMSGTGSAAHVFNTGGESFIEIVGIRITNVTSASYCGIRLGSNSTGNTDGCAAKYCAVENQTALAGILVETNLGVVGHTVDHCQINSNSLYGIYFDGSLLGTKLSITNNSCSSNGRSGIRGALSSGSISLTGIIANNTCNSNGVTAATSPYGIGIDIVSNVADMAYTGNTCNDNYINGMMLGCFSGASDSNRFLASGNTCLRNGEMGITVSRGGGWAIVNNVCNYNGANRGNKYGRGIELFGGSTTPVGPGWVYFNECSYNYNYGGTINNGTEGVGIGLDDYHKDVRVVGNLVVGNEGNGIQWNPNGASGTSRVFGNVVIDNFAAPTSRAASWSNFLKAQMCSFTTENNVIAFNNTVVLTSPSAAPACLYGFSESDIAAGTNTLVGNNLFKGHNIAMKIRSGVSRSNNGFYGNTVNVQSNVDTTALTNGTGAVTADPVLDSSYKPTAVAYKGAGANYGGMDRTGKPFPSTPSIGALEISALTVRYYLK